MRWAQVASKGLGSTANILKRSLQLFKSGVGNAGAVRGVFSKLPNHVRNNLVMNVALTQSRPGKGIAGLLKGGARASSWVLGQAVRRPILTSTVGIGLSGSVGAIRGAYSAAIQAEPRRIYNDPQSPIIGPGYNIWAKERGMDPNALGASGSLALALHKVRHR